MEPAFTTDSPAFHAIRVSGEIGPVLLSALRRGGCTRLDSARTSTVNIIATDVDIVDIVERCNECGMEIESLREIGCPAD